MGLFKRMFGSGGDRAAMAPLYHAIVEEARTPGWYRDGGVPDTIDGRFDMVALVLAFVLIRLERAGVDARGSSARLTEVFVDDMDGTMREIGFGDLVVGKRVGGMMGALGGRLGAYRSGDRREAILRNVYRGVEPEATALDWTVAHVAALEAQLAELSDDAVLAGQIG